jgi:ubiquinone/menaquinone biosynthesis C-methylase UbiE
MTNPVQARYDAIAEVYEKRWSRYVKSSVRETLERLHLRTGERLLDIGCGTGALIAELLRRAPNSDVAGIDLSYAMTAIARHRVPISVPLVVGDAERLPFADGSFTALVSSSSFHYWAAPAALRELRRVLHPNGRLILTDWCDDFLVCKVCDRFLRLADSAHRRIYGQQACREFLVEAGFHDITIERYRISWIWGLMTATATAA